MLAAVAAAVVLGGCGSTTIGTTSPSQRRQPPSVALSNSYDGNSWRQAMVASFTKEAAKAKQDHLISKFEVVNADDSATEQIGQIESMILQGYRVIAIDAASTTSLNGVIARACRYGVTVVAFDSLVTAPCAYEVATNYVAYGEAETSYVAKLLHGHGNLLEIRGIAGTSVDEDVNKGVHHVLAHYPGMKIVGRVYGEWTESVAQTAVEGVLPSLPTVNGVVDEGGDGSGAAQAFQSLHKTVPSIVMGNRGQELEAWESLQKREPGYRTVSISSMPGMVDVAMWVGQQVATGHHVPHIVYAPLLEIPQSHLAAWRRATPASSVASRQFNLAQSRQLIRDNERGQPPTVVTSLPS